MPARRSLFNDSDSLNGDGEGGTTTIKLPLRRTLVLSVFYSAFAKSPYLS